MWGVRVQDRSRDLGVLAQASGGDAVVSAEDNLRDDLRATRERQVRMRSELRHLNERQEALQAKCRSLGEHALLLEGALEETLVALDAQKPEEARALLGVVLAAAKLRNGDGREPRE
jgi:chromosome segregation ATPase